MKILTFSEAVALFELLVPADLRDDCDSEIFEHLFDDSKHEQELQADAPSGLTAGRVERLASRWVRKMSGEID